MAEQLRLGTCQLDGRWAAVLREGNRALWTCSHDHLTRAEAVICVKSTLRRAKALVRMARAADPNPPLPQPGA